MAELKLSVLPAQQKLILSRSPIAAFVGGFGSGKTRGAVYKATTLGFENAPTLGIFVEPTYRMIMDVAVRSFQEVYAEIGMPYEYLKADQILRVADTFDILLRSGDQPDRLIGINAGWGIIDEPASQSEDVPKMVQGRLRDSRAKLRQLVLTGTPQGFNWFHDWCHALNEDGSPRVEVIRARTYDNPYLGREYIEELRKSYTDEEIQAYIEGNFVRFEGAWYKVTPPVLPYRTTNLGAKIFREPHNSSDQLVIGVDTAGGLGRDRSAVAVIDKKDEAVVASWVSDKATIAEMVSVVIELSLFYQRQFVSVLPPYVPPALSSKPVIIVEVDGIGRATFQELTHRDPSLHIVQVNTKENTRYSGLLLAKRAVEAGKMAGPEELAEETRDLFVEDGKFKGKKDLSMAIGFCLNHIRESPYRAPLAQVSPETLDLMAKIKRKNKNW